MFTVSLVEVVRCGEWTQLKVSKEPMIIIRFSKILDINIMKSSIEVLFLFVFHKSAQGLKRNGVICSKANTETAGIWNS